MASEALAHVQDFLNGVCTHTIWVTEKRLTYYTGMKGSQSNTAGPPHTFNRQSMQCSLQLVMHECT